MLQLQLLTILDYDYSIVIYYYYYCCYTLSYSIGKLNPSCGLQCAATVYSILLCIGYHPKRKGTEHIANSSEETPDGNWMTVLNSLPQALCRRILQDNRSTWYICVPLLLDSQAKLWPVLPVFVPVFVTFVTWVWMFYSYTHIISYHFVASNVCQNAPGTLCSQRSRIVEPWLLANGTHRISFCPNHPTPDVTG